MARLGRVQVTGLDVSRTFVQIGTEKARQAGVAVDFHQGDAAVIQDMNRDATHAEIALEVGRMKLGWLTSFTTKATLESLKRRAYSPAHFERLVAESPFRTCQIQTEGIGLDIRLTKERISDQYS